MSISRCHRYRLGSCRLRQWPIARSSQFRKHSLKRRLACCLLSALKSSPCRKSHTVILILTTASHRDSRKEKGWFWANQFDNIANRLLRYRTTVPGGTGRGSAFVSTIGTVGRLALADTALYLNERSKEVVVVCAEPHGDCHLVLVCGWVTRRSGMARLMRKESARRA
jgi:hypothetical protein